jgi:hypothetical protein
MYHQVEVGVTVGNLDHPVATLVLGVHRLAGSRNSDRPRAKLST